MVVPISHPLAARCVQVQSRDTWGQAMTDETPDFSGLDDSALLSARAEMRAELEGLPPLSAAHAALSAWYAASLNELVERARTAWARAN